MYNILKYMSINPTNKIKITATTLIAVFACAAFAFAEDNYNAPKTNFTAKKAPAKAVADEEQDLTELQKMARQYRAQGLSFQDAGDIDAAMSLYQKAIELDPLYPAPFNDLGVILESKGFVERAEEVYKRCIQIDPNYVSAYTNLALLYEGQRDINQAAMYWEKRARLGDPADPWTQKASQRLNDIRLVLSDKPFEEAKEQDVMGLMNDVATQKKVLSKDDKALARNYFKKAKQNYRKGDEVTALKLAVDAQQIDPTNEDIEAFVDKLRTRALSK
jgi:tetratricopeptide (TPR) repeat protein